MEISQLVGWTPINIRFRKDQAVVEWCHLNGAAFTEPFFDQTVVHCLQQTHASRQRTSIEAVAELQTISPGLAPTGFIFHMSRCGSTLISQMLAALPQNLVISEANPIQIILSTKIFNPDITDVQRLTWLQGVVSALGQRRRGTEKHYFIKFNSWNVLYLPLIQQAFPTVPWIFVYRDPVEVIVSLLKEPPGWMQNLAEPQFLAGLLDLDNAEVSQMQVEECFAKVLACFCHAALEHHRTDALMLNYQQLPSAVWSSLLDFFQVAHSSADVSCMQQVSQVDAKNPAKQFTGDTVAKQQEASELVRQMTKRWVGNLYEQLEAVSLSQRMVC